MIISLYANLVNRTANKTESKMLLYIIVVKDLLVYDKTKIFFVTTSMCACVLFLMSIVM